MIHGQNFKVVNVTPPAAKVDDASFATAVVDTLGFDYCTFFLILGDTDIAMTALKVQESDSTSEGNLVSGADVVGTVFATATTIDGATSALPTANDDNDVFAIGIDLRGRKRYLDMVATAGNGSTGTYGTIIAILSRGEQPPTTATGMGLNQMLRC